MGWLHTLVRSYRDIPLFIAFFAMSCSGARALKMLDHCAEARDEVITEWPEQDDEVPNCHEEYMVCAKENGIGKCDEVLSVRLGLWGTKLEFCQLPAAGKYARKEWWVRISEEGDLGPLTIGDVADLIVSGELVVDSEVRFGDSSQWIPVTGSRLLWPCIELRKHGPLVKSWVALSDEHDLEDQNIGAP